jgi:hypothetical protein
MISNAYHIWDDNEDQDYLGILPFRKTKHIAFVPAVFFIFFQFSLILVLLPNTNFLLYQMS